MEAEVTHKVLLVDDDPDNLTIVKRLLVKEGYQVQTVGSGDACLKALDFYDPDLVLLDVNMPGMDGLETIRMLKQREKAVGVVFVTSNTNTQDIVDGLGAGALDYIAKPFSGLELLARVKAQLDMKKLQDELRQANEKLKNLVEIDDLTGLYNMRSIYTRLDQEIQRTRRYQHSMAVIMLDMDHFKRVNDNHDHLFGSHVLKEVGQLIRQQLRSHDFAARYGGDEFLICLCQTHPQGARTFCKNLKDSIENHLFKMGSDQIQLTASMGCALILKGQSMMDSRSLVRHADHGLYASKEEGRNQITYTEIKEDLTSSHDS